MTGSQSWKGAIATPEGHYLQNCKQASLLTKTSWGSGQSTSAWESAPVVHPENRVAGMGEVISCSDCTHQTPHYLNCSDLRRAQNAGPNESAPLRTSWVPETEQLRTGRCVQPRAGLRCSQWSSIEPEQCGQGGHTRPVWLRYCGHTPVLFVCSVPPSPQRNWTSEPTKSVHHCPPCVRAEIRHWRDQQTEEAKTEGTALEVTGAID